MSVIITILNLLGIGYLWKFDYKLVEGLNRLDGSKELDLNIFLFFLIVFLVFKVGMFYFYNIKWSIMDIKYFLPDFSSSKLELDKSESYKEKVDELLVSNKKISTSFKVISLLGLFLDFFIFLGFSFIFFKIILIELQFSLEGKIPLLGITRFFIPSSEQWYLYKIYSTDQKISFITNLLEQLSSTHALVLKDLEIGKVSFGHLPTHIKNMLLKKDNLKDIKKPLEDYFISIIENRYYVNGWWEYINSYATLEMFKFVMFLSGMSFVIAFTGSKLGYLNVDLNLFSGFFKSKETTYYKVSEKTLKVFTDNQKDFIKAMDVKHSKMNEEVLRLGTQVRKLTSYLNKEKSNETSLKLLDEINRLKSDHKLDRKELMFIAQKVKEENKIIKEKLPFLLNEKYNFKSLNLELNALDVLKKKSNLEEKQSILIFIIDKILKNN